MTSPRPSASGTRERGTVVHPGPAETSWFCLVWSVAECLRGLESDSLHGSDRRVTNVYFLVGGYWTSIRLLRKETGLPGPV